ncbi:hypothetical protein [Streptomyces sp. NPDC002845]
MTTNPTPPDPQRDNGYQELRMYVLLLVLAVGLLVVGAAAYLVRVHPSLLGPVSVGAAVLGALAAVVEAAARTARRQ